MWFGITTLGTVLSATLLGISSVEAGAVNGAVKLRNFLATRNTELFDTIGSWTSRPNSTLEDARIAGMAEDVINAILQRPFGAPLNSSRRYAFNYDRAKKFFGDLRLNEVPYLNQQEYCTHIATFLDLFPQSILTKLDLQCVNIILNRINQRRVQPQALAGIPSEWIRGNGPRVIRSIETRRRKIGGDRQLYHLNDNAFRALMKDPESCRMINPQSLAHLKTNQYKQFTPTCMAAIPGVGTVSLEKVVGKFDKHIFSQYNGSLSTSTLERIPASHLHHFGKGLKTDEYICYNLALDEVGNLGLKGLTMDCLVGYLKRGNVNELGKKWNFIPKDIMSTFYVSDLEILENIPSEDLKYLPTEVLKVIFSEEAGCLNFPEHGELQGNAKGLMLTASCAAKIKNGKVLGQILAAATELPDDILSEFDAESIKTIEFTPSRHGGNTLQGLMILEALKGRELKNLRSIVEKISSNTDNEHACGSIDNVTQYLAMSVIRQYPTAKCISSLGFEFTKAELRQIPEVFAMRPFDEILATFTEEDWKKLSKENLAMMITQADFASKIGEKLYLINPEALVSLDGKTTLALKDKLNKDLVPHLDDKAFALFTKDDMQSVTITMLTDKQLPHLSAEIQDLNNNAFATVTAAMMTELSSKVSLFEKRQWAAVPAKAMTSITISMFATIPAGKMTLWRLEHVNNMSDQVLATISADQMTHIGKEVASEKESPVPRFKKLYEKMSKEAQAAYKARPNSATALMPTAFAFLAGIVAAVLLI